MALLIDLHFLPSLEYFCALAPYEKVYVEKHEHFVKQSFRNRCYIATSQGVEMLTVPVSNRHGKVPMSEVRIDYRQRWPSIHRRAIETAYRKAPFFDHYQSDFNLIFSKQHPLLFDLNREILSFCLTALGWQKEIAETEEFLKGSSLVVNDLRSAITPKKDFTDREFYQPTPYYQVFGSTFVPNLSILDLLFNEGPRAASLLRSSIKQANN